jgi:thioredoxin reductase
MDTSLLDAVVIGGGAAGLAGAVTLARSRRSVLVIDGAEPRNARADGVHALLALDGVAPAELLARGRAEVERYGGRILPGTVSRAHREADRFVVDLADGTRVRARRLLVATGAIDRLPEIPGLAEHWGHAVVHCPYCHGWEVRDRAIGVIASHPMFTHQALLFRQLSEDVVVFLHGVDPTPEQRSQLQARGIELVEDEIESIESEGDAVTGVRLRDGRVVPREVLTVQSMLAPRIGALVELGLRPVDHPMGQHVPATDIGGRSEVPGVWLAGNVTDPSAQVGASAAAGTMAGAQINADLVMAETAAAVAALSPAG